MTNAQIIFLESVDLMEKGIIGATGRPVKCKMANGTETIINEPEEIHTYLAWKELGYQVQKGEKAVASFAIWKHTVRKAKKEDEEDRESMFMKTSSFFKRSQVAPIQPEVAR